VLTVGEGRQVPVDLLYPAASLKPIAAILSSKVQSRRQAEDPAWTNNLMRAAMNVKLPVRSVLAEPVIPLSQLMSLQPGDIIPISFGPEIPLRVANHRFARGAVGAANGRAAIRVHRIEPIENEDA
jgi:flagellar motor switch protein FliM